MDGGGISESELCFYLSVLRGDDDRVPRLGETFSLISLQSAGDKSRK